MARVHQRKTPARDDEIAHTRSVDLSARQWPGSASPSPPASSSFSSSSSLHHQRRGHRGRQCTASATTRGGRRRRRTTTAPRSSTSGRPLCTASTSATSWVSPLSLAQRTLSMQRLLQSLVVFLPLCATSISRSGRPACSRFQSLERLGPPGAPGRLRPVQRGQPGAPVRGRRRRRHQVHDRPPRALLLHQRRAGALRGRPADGRARRGRTPPTRQRPWFFNAGAGPGDDPASRHSAPYAVSRAEAGRGGGGSVRGRICFHLVDRMALCMLPRLELYSMGFFFQ